MLFAESKPPFLFTKPIFGLFRQFFAITSGYEPSQKQVPAFPMIALHPTSTQLVQVKSYKTIGASQLRFLFPFHDVDNGIIAALTWLAQFPDLLGLGQRGGIWISCMALKKSRCSESVRDDSSTAGLKNIFLIHEGFGSSGSRFMRQMKRKIWLRLSPIYSAISHNLI